MTSLPSAFSTATEMVSRWTSRPTYLMLFIGCSFRQALVTASHSNHSLLRKGRPFIMRAPHKPPLLVWVFYKCGADAIYSCGQQSPRPQESSPAERDGRRKPSDSSLGKLTTRTHSSLPKACAQAVGRSAQKESDPRPPRNPRLLFALLLLRVLRASVVNPLSSHFGNFWLLKFPGPSLFT